MDPLRIRLWNIVPVYLDGKVQQFVERIAESKRTDVSAVVNGLLRTDMELVEAAK